jgi:hypothetical protein
MARARMYAKEIRKSVPFLLLYGPSSNRYLRDFWFADGFITQSHYISAFNRKRLVGTRWEPFDGDISETIITENFKQIKANLIELEIQSGGLRQWVEDTEETVRHTPQRAMAVRKPLREIGTDS